MSKDKASKKPMPPPAAFGSSPGGRGNAGQGKARLSPESAPEESSSAGAHAAISTNENGHETPSKVRTDGAQSVLKSIAEQLRAVPGKTDRILDAEKMAGRLLAEALKHGAFARIKHAHLRTWIDERIEKGLYGSAFGSAVYWFRQYEPHWPSVAAWQDVGSASCVKNGCPLLADVLEAEADVPESERVLTPPVPGRLEAEVLRKRHDDEIQARKEGHDRRQVDAQEVAAGKWGHASEPGQMVSLRSGLYALPKAAQDAPSAGEAVSPFPWGRVFLLAVLLLVLESGAIVAACYLGEGKNALQSIGACWWLLAFVFTIIVLVAPIILGREGWLRVKRWWNSAMGEAQ